LKYLRNQSVIGRNPVRARVSGPLRRADGPWRYCRAASLCDPRTRGLGLSLGLLALVGFDATQAVHSDQSLMSLRVLYIVGPVLMYMAAFVLARRYPLTSSRQERIQSWIERRDLRLQAAAAPENCQARI